MKRTFPFCFAYVLLVAMHMNEVVAQTFVSGDITANTTWTKSNSPYVVTDTVVVLPGIVLTIEPGVIVKFDSAMLLRIQGGSLIANGVGSDSITFTSSSINPVRGSWSGITIFTNSLSSEFSYCNIRYAKRGIDYDGGAGSVNIDYCTFTENKTAGISSQGAIKAITIKHSLIADSDWQGLEGGNIKLIDSCMIKDNLWYGIYNVRGVISNSTIMGSETGIYCFSPGYIEKCRVYGNYEAGISLHGGSTVRNCTVDGSFKFGIVGGSDTITDCLIRRNGTGISIGGGVVTRNVIDDNSIGLYVLSSAKNIYCNRLSNYDFDVRCGPNSVLTPNIANNYWGTSDSTYIASRIYDGNDTAGLDTVIFMPVDDSECYLTTVISTPIYQNPNFFLHPNPATDHVTISVDDVSPSAEVIITDVTGRKMLAAQLQTVNTKLQTDNLSSGVYLVTVTKRAGGTATKRLVIQK